MLKIAYNAKGRQGWNKIPKKTECLIRSDRRKYSRINVWENISKPLNAVKTYWNHYQKKTNFPLTWTSKAPCLSTHTYMHLHKYLVLLHEVLLPSIPDVRSIAAGHQLTRTHALKHCEKLWMPYSMNFFTRIIEVPHVVFRTSNV